MTVISAVLTEKFIVVSTDSIITKKDKDGKRNRMDRFSKRKYVCFTKLKCIVSYWGLAYIEANNKVKWITFDWLESKIKEQEKFADIKSFVKYLAEELNAIINGYRFEEEKYLGIHITGFENFGDNWIPELFFISKSTMNKHVDYSRRIDLDRYNHNLPQRPTEQLRDEYLGILRNGGFSLYNNGDNEMFNNFATPFYNAVQNANKLGKLKGGLDKNFFINLAKNPIIEVASFQKKYFIKESIIVGGKIHYIVMDSDGKIDSNN